MIKSVQKATKLLTMLSDHYSSPVPLATLSQKLELNKSTCSHILSTLEAEGFVTKISSSKGYILGPAAYCLSRFGKYQSRLISICRPVMDRLFEELGHTVVLAVIEHEKKYILDYIDSGSTFETEEQIRTDDIYRTATGRAILCNLPLEKVYAIYEKFGKPAPNEWPGINSFSDLKSYILKAQKKQQGLFKTTGFQQKNQIYSVGYAAPFFNNIECVGALGIALHTKNVQSADFLKAEKAVLPLLSRGAASITEQMKACRL